MSTSRSDPHSRVEEADDFLKNQVYSDANFKVNSQGKLIASGEKANAVVTLTYAQSLDAKIAGKNGKQIQLSGPESAVMTHRLRAMHTHIMVGAGTLLNDNPQLNCRLPSMLPLEQQPIPVILDPQVQTPVTCKLIHNAKAGLGHYPVILTRKHIASEVSKVDQASRVDELRNAGCTIKFFDKENKEAKLSISDIVNSLDLGRSNSLMIEGGATLISSLLSTPPPADGRQIDRLIITMASTFVGEDGVSISVADTQPTKALKHIATKVFGRDPVVTYGF